MAKHYIALDVHCAFSEMCVVTQGGKVVDRERLPTTVPDLREAITRFGRPRHLTFEEGPLADWLSRELYDHVDRLVVCEPRRNHWIARDGDKDDPIDAQKLADLFRGDFLKEVYQNNNLDRSLLKQHVAFYHDRVRERVRQGHQLVGMFRRHGVFVAAGKLLDDDYWNEAFGQVPQKDLLQCTLRFTRYIYQTMSLQEEELRKGVVRLARQEELVRRFQAIPGVGWIRGLTFYTIIDTPHRFRNRKSLFKYCGIGLERRHSGNGPMRMRLSKRGSRRLKDVLIGAAQSTINQKENAFADKYHHWIKKGLSTSHARRNVARCIAATMDRMWKHNESYDKSRVAEIANE